MTTRFFVGQTRINSLEVYHNGIRINDGSVSDVDETRGSFTYAPSGYAPSGMVQASFYYQWFTDAELIEFLNEASQMLSFESASGDIAIGLRPTLMAFATYNAYMRKAAEFAETVEASAAGYTFKRGQATRNWEALAKTALEQGKAKLKLYVDDPLDAKRPSIAIIHFSLGRYQPP